MLGKALCQYLDPVDGCWGLRGGYYACLATNLAKILRQLNFLLIKVHGQQLQTLSNARSNKPTYVVIFLFFKHLIMEKIMSQPASLLEEHCHKAGA